MATSRKRVRGVTAPLHRWLAVFNIRGATISAGHGRDGTAAVEFGIVQGPMYKFLHASYAGEVRCGYSA